MERRGFIESFAKAAAGAVLSPKSLLGKEDDRPDRLRYLPRVVKICDETLLDAQNGLVLSSLKASLKAGFSALYPDIAEKYFIDTLFPGLLEGAFIGLNIYFPDIVNLLGNKIAAGMVETLSQMPHKESGIDSAHFVLWQGKVSSGKTLTGLKTPEDFPIDDNLDTPLELAEGTVIPCPALSRIHQFQIGLVSGISDYRGENYCRDLYLSCFLHKDKADWFAEYDQTQRWSLFERLSYPQGMKFRLFAVERIQAEKAIYLCGDGVILDKYFNYPPEEVMDNHIKLVTLINPSAPVVRTVNWKRRGGDNILSWADADYRGRWQVYRSGEADFPPAKSNLIGITGNLTFTDRGTAATGKWYYTVTREWGDVII